MKLSTILHSPALKKSRTESWEKKKHKNREVSHAMRQKIQSTISLMTRKEHKLSSKTMLFNVGYASCTNHYALTPDIIFKHKLIQRFGYPPTTPTEINNTLERYGYVADTKIK